MRVDNWLDAQYSVLGSALIDDRVVPAVVSGTSDDDYSGGCKNVFRAIRGLFDKGSPVDPVSVNAALGGNYREFLMQLMEITPTAANVESYIRICREQARVNAIRDLAAQLQTAETMDEARKLLEQANGWAADTQRQKARTLAEMYVDFAERQKQKPKYLRWPIEQLQDNMYVSPGNLVILAAEPSVGKTAFTLQCALHWAKSQNVGFFSYDTPFEDLEDRLVSHGMTIPYDDILHHRLNEKQWSRFGYIGAQNANRSLSVEIANGMTVSDIRARTIQKGYDVIVIDYLQQISSKGSSRYEQVTNISLGLKQLATSLGVIVIALSQVSRSDDGHTPRNSDLRESGQLEQDADVVIFLKLRNQTDKTGPRSLYVTKFKRGSLFKTNLAFDGEHQTFSWISEVAAKAYDAQRQAGKKPKIGKTAAPEIPEQTEVPGQMDMLPEDTPVPFEK